MIDDNDLIPEIILLPIANELIDLCKHANEYTRRCWWFRNHQQCINYCQHRDRKCENDGKNNTNVEFKNFKTF